MDTSLNDIDQLVNGKFHTTTSVEDNVLKVWKYYREGKILVATINANREVQFHNKEYSGINDTAYVIKKAISIDPLVESKEGTYFLFDTPPQLLLCDECILNAEHVDNGVMKYRGYIYRHYGRSWIKEETYLEFQKNFKNINYN